MEKHTTKWTTEHIPIGMKEAKNWEEKKNRNKFHAAVVHLRDKQKKNNIIQYASSSSRFPILLASFLSVAIPVRFELKDTPNCSFIQFLHSYCVLHVSFAYWQRNTGKKCYCKKQKEKISAVFDVFTP